MAKKFFRKKSKRIPARLRYKVEKKVREHHRKLRREAKKNPKKSRPKDPGIPNNLPFKDKILVEAEERKRRAEEMRQRQKEERQKEQMKRRDLSDLAKDAAQRTEEYEENEALGVAMNTDTAVAGPSSDPSLKAYYKEFSKVVEAADVVVEVLDARDPLGTRCSEVEKAVINAGTDKRLILVLNKIDLVPKENLLKWLKYLRDEFPTVAFKACTQTQKENLSRKKVAAIHSTESLLKSKHCLGANMLMKILGNYCRNQGIQTVIRVGVVGFPNVGKSSIINSLKRSRACTVGATPGITKSVQEVQLDKHIKLLDSPGIVFAKEGSEAMKSLRNAIKIETLKDCITPVEAIVSRTTKDQLMLYYRLPEFHTTHEFLCLLARRIGRLKKGGVPNTEAAARKVLVDWNTGKIKYYTVPPETHTLPAHLSAEIVSEMGKSFDIEKIEKDEDQELKTLPTVLPSDAILVNSSQEIEAVTDKQEMDTEDL